jgi:hypothetical protein
MVMAFPIKNKKLFYFGPNPVAMKLMMYLGNDLVESLPVNVKELSVPGYLGRLKRQLRQKHSDLVKQTGLQPEYLVIPIPEPTAGVRIN